MQKDKCEHAEEYINNTFLEMYICKKDYCDKKLYFGGEYFCTKYNIYDKNKHNEAEHRGV